MTEQRTAYRSTGKRAFDLFGSVLGLLFLWPAFLLIAIFVKLTSPGPVFYRQERVGKSGRRFKIIKFRTMHVDAGQRGPGITIGDDSRITSLGRMMRRLKVDELPQLWNVLKGEMSLVGPRPELPVYVASFSEPQQRVLEVRPGITDPASIVYRRESDQLAGHADPERYYRDVVLPHKLALNLEYIHRMSWRRDLSLLAQTCLGLWFKRPPLIYSAPADKASSGTSWLTKSSN
jgi:lipopolysaccharide/colanic/teichoic acid biosynthesis glycosyltransferase